MWFIGSFALVCFMFLLCWLLGQAFLSVMRFQLPLWKPESAAFGGVLGAAILILTSGWISWLGFPMRGNGVILTVLLASFSLITMAWKWQKLSSEKRSFPDRRRLMPLLGLLALIGIVSYLGLLSLLRDNAFNPYNDTFVSINLGEYLQDHSFRVPVQLRVQNPVAASVYMFQISNLRMGVHFLLALVQSWVPNSRSIDLFPALSVFGIVLDLLTVYLCCRWLIRMPVFHSLCACLFGFTNFNLALASANAGMMNQLFGVAFSFTGLVLASRLYAASTGRVRGWIILLGVISAALISSYNEIVPMFGLILLSALGLRALRARHWKWQPLVRLIMAGGIAAILSNIELLRSLKNIALLMKLSPGWHIDFSVMQFAGSWLGVYPTWFDDDLYRNVIGHSLLMWWQQILAVVIFTLVAISIFRLAVKFRFLRYPEFSCAMTVYAGLVIYFACFVKNPFIPGHIGQTWSISKLVIYSFPLGICVFVAAFRRLPYARPIIFAIAVVSAVSCWPIHDEFSHLRTEVVRANTLSADRPFGAYVDFAETVKHLANGRPVRFVIPASFPNKHFAIAAYYLYPALIASDDWRNTGCIYEGLGFVNPPPQSMLTLMSVIDPAAEGEPLPAGFLVQTEPPPLQP